MTAALRGPARCALVALALPLAACGKRGDPLPPLRRTPQPVTGLRVAQRGEALEVSLQAPRATTDGVRLPVLEVELMRADAAGDFQKLAKRQIRKLAPGETWLEQWPLPAAGTTVRFAARALARGRPSLLTSVVALTVQAPPQPPTGLAARSAEKGVRLTWKPPEVMPAPAPTPEPSPSPVPTPSPAETAAPSPSPTPTPSPTPQPPTTGFFVYRRARQGSYTRSLEPIPAQQAAFDDTRALPGESWCYLVRTVAATDPVIESAPTEETCLDVMDVVPPSPPTGVAVLARDGALEVSWSPSSEADLAGYRVYRAPRGGAPPGRLGERPAGETVYHDAGAEPGVVYVYTVRAVDKAGNESAPSSPALGSRP